MRGRGRVITAVGVGTVAMTLLTGCAPWLAANPQFATDAARNTGSGPVTSTEPGGPQAIAVPRRPGVEGLHRQGFRGRRCPADPRCPAGVRRLRRRPRPDRRGTGTVTIGVMRPGRSKRRRTPGRSSSPPVLTCPRPCNFRCGCPGRASTSGAQPVVAVDRRGMGMSSPIECRDDYDPPADAGTGPVPAGRRPGGHAGHHHPDGDHRMHRRHSPGELGYDSAGPPGTWNDCAAPGTCPRWR